MIVPGERIGPVTAASTRQSLAKQIGADNVRPSEIPIGEGETLKGLLVYPGTANELQIIWKDAGGTPASIVLYGAQDGGETGKWRTREGLGIGSPLGEVERANDRAFRLYGFGWDYGGRTAGWSGGKLNEAMYMDFRPTADLGKAAEAVMGDAEFSSGHPVMQQLKPVVRRIAIEFK